MSRCYPERGVEGGNRPHHPDLGPPRTYDPSSVLTMCTGNCKFGEGASDSGTIRDPGAKLGMGAGGRKTGVRSYEHGMRFGGGRVQGR